MADKPQQQSEQAPKGRRWISDNFEGVVHVHGIDGEGTSRPPRRGG